MVHVEFELAASPCVVHVIPLSALRLIASDLPSNEELTGTLSVTGLVKNKVVPGTPNSTTAAKLVTLLATEFAVTTLILSKDVNASALKEPPPDLVIIVPLGINVCRVPFAVVAVIFVLLAAVIEVTLAALEPVKLNNEGIADAKLEAGASA